MAIEWSNCLFWGLDEYDRAQEVRGPPPPRVVTDPRVARPAGGHPGVLRAAGRPRRARPSPPWSRSPRRAPPEASPPPGLIAGGVAGPASGAGGRGPGPRAPGLGRPGGDRRGLRPRLRGDARGHRVPGPGRARALRRGPGGRAAGPRRRGAGRRALRPGLAGPQHRPRHPLHLRPRRHRQVGQGGGGVLRVARDRPAPPVGALRLGVGAGPPSATGTRPPGDCASRPGPSDPGHVQLMEPEARRAEAALAVLEGDRGAGALTPPARGRRAGRQAGARRHGAGRAPRPRPPRRGRREVLGRGSRSWPATSTVGWPRRSSSTPEASRRTTGRASGAAAERFAALGADLLAAEAAAQASAAFRNAMDRRQRPALGRPLGRAGRGPRRGGHARPCTSAASRPSSPHGNGRSPCWRPAGSPARRSPSACRCPGGRSTTTCTGPTRSWA